MALGSPYGDLELGSPLAAMGWVGGPHWRSWVVLGVPTGSHGFRGPHWQPWSWGSPLAAIELGVPIVICVSCVGSPFCFLGVTGWVWGLHMGTWIWGSPLEVMGWVGGPHWQPWDALGVPIWGHRVGGPHGRPLDGLGVPIGGHGMGWGSPYGVMDLGVPIGGHGMGWGSPLAAMGCVGGPHMGS